MLISIGKSQFNRIIRETKAVLISIGKSQFNSYTNLTKNAQYTKWHQNNEEAQMWCLSTETKE